MNLSKENKKFEETLENEGHALIGMWLDDSFYEKITGYIMMIMDKKASNQKFKL